ncbi:N2,N2-dimethylguanosine tRNA methyltransferase [Seinonella peptonophila]|uniref:N2,N2-dimethylguanosine tRNA methyltransferase n=2 Tax=Seinonella peptonophila TaxID=112248 RepID=A0A1M4VDN7_9BACL|nr:N2,N2-dimethylguanosine tRNA methyltransferase [Seinonella peptonophila]
MKDVENKSYKEIAEVLNTTVSSVKHKYIRLHQSKNNDKHHHPIEKKEQINRVLSKDQQYRILETHAGNGNLTKLYLEFGEVVAHDIDQTKICRLEQIKNPNLKIMKCDSFKRIHHYIYEKQKFNVIDLDPYGYPSRFFPHIFQLIEEGYFFMTIPKIGVQQVNKIMIEHYRLFWGMDLSDKESYVQKIDAKMKDFALCYFRTLDLIDCVDLGRLYRLAYKVKKESAFNLFGYGGIRG